ncbi:MAG: TldD/PmbA family protein [Defluviitaleaceae bacterium]|nr:TldD/PmbA family protein [Defluviitaleaceae bacterium]
MKDKYEMSKKTEDVAQYALDVLKKSGADKSSCRIVKGRNDEFGILANKFTDLSTVFTDELHLKALVGGRKGVVVVNKTDKQSIDEAVENCIALAKSAEPDAAEDIASLEENKNFDNTTGKGADMDGLFSRSKEYLEQVRDEFPKIMVEEFSSSYWGGETVYVNSNGVCFFSKNEYYHYSSMFVGKDGEKSSSFNHGGSYLADMSEPFMNAGMHRTLLQEAENSLNPRIAEEKFVGKIIVTPACDDILWETIMTCFLSDRAMIEETSRWKDALGTVVADKKLTYSASPLSPLVVADPRFTSDGFIMRDVDFIRDGVLKSFALSLYGSNKTGKPRADTSLYNIEVAPGDTPLSQMIKGVERGVLLNRFSGGSPSASGDISGVAKNSFLIENGAVTDALQETMISFNILDVLKNITAISKERVTNGATILPWTCIDGVTVSGK